MKYITIPQPVRIPTGTDSSISYGVSNMLTEFAWCRDDWRTKEAQPMLFRLLPLFKQAEPGDVIELTDAEFEKLLPMAIRRGEKIEPHLVLPLNTLMTCFICAVDEDPR